MSRSKQLKKVKTYRILKVVFYFLGLPLFMFAVFCTAIKFMGQDPFVGTATITPNLGFFIGYERFLTAPALFGIWCAVGVWALISICHLVLAKTVKSRRARMFAVLAIVLVVMLGGTFLMDIIFDAQIDKMIATAPAGVTIQDYKSQLSYYSHVSYGRKNGNLTKQLKEKVQLLEKVYNVEWEGIDKSGVSGNISNKPIDYFYIISDPNEDGICEQGIDISFRPRKDGIGYEIATDDKGNLIGNNEKSVDVEGAQLVRIPPDENGNLIINGKTFSHYHCVSRTGMNGEKTYLWYAKDLQPDGTTFDGKVSHTQQDGVYGKALYNKSGLLSDGWVFSFENVLRILEDYYEGKMMLDTLDPVIVELVRDSAADIRDRYYKGLIPLPSTVANDGTGEYVDPWTKALFSQETVFTENFSLTRGELEYLLSNVGLLLGDNSLFDWLLATDGVEGIPFIGSLISPILEELANGYSLRGLLGKFAAANVSEETMGTVFEWIKRLTGKPENYAMNDLYIVLVYKNMNDEDALFKSDHLYFALYRDNGEGAIDLTENGRLLDVDFDEGLLEGGEDGEYNFDLDRLSEFLNVALNAALGQLPFSLSNGIVNTLLGLVLQDIDVTKPNGDTETYKGLVISGISIPLFNSEWEVDIDINGILTGLLQNWYSYQSAAIKPVWEFYSEVPNLTEDVVEEIQEASIYLAKYERALYEATVYGSMMGSTLIGDSLGAGTYGSSFGLNDLTSVRQLISDLSYQRVYFPLYSFRDMMLAFSGIVLLFYFLSFFAAEKEELYATGKLLGKVTKQDLEQELISAPDSPSPGEVSFETTVPETDPLMPIETETDGPPETETDPNDSAETGEDPAVPSDENNEGEVRA